MLQFDIRNLARSLRIPIFSIALIKAASLFSLFLYIYHITNVDVDVIDTRMLWKRDEGNETCVSENKKQLVALLLSIFIGELGVDQFYIGNIGLGVGKLLTFGGFGIWWLVDVILLAINEHYTDKNSCILQPI